MIRTIVLVSLSACLAALPALAAPMSSIPSRGSVSAPITVIMFGDFQCPYCVRGAQMIAQVAKEMPGEFKVVYRHYPLEFHASARPAARAAVCAQDQGKFWEMHDRLFAMKATGLNDVSIDKVAIDIGLDMGAFTSCVASAGTDARVQRDIDEGNLLGLSGTPSFLIVGPGSVKRVGGVYPANEMKAFILQTK